MRLLRSTHCTAIATLACAVAFGACAVEDDSLQLLDSRAQLIRVSTDLLGVHPSEEELLAIEESPELYEEFVDRYLEDERFIKRLLELYNLRFLTRDGTDLGEEPLQLLAHVVTNDLSFDELILADYTMANPALAAEWNIEIPDAAGGWQAGWYEDGRPHAGLLTMTSIWQRYPSGGGNANRHRANAVSRLLLCDDYLDRPIAFSRNVVDQVATDPEETIRVTTSCQSCHSTLDPLSSHFFGFPSFMDDAMDGTEYRAEHELGWQDYSEQPPGYFGTPTSTIRELAVELAQDPRFIDCATQNVFEAFTQRQVTDADWAELQEHRVAFTESGLRLRELVRSIVVAPEYRAADAADPELSARLTTVRTVSPAQLASVMEGITGFRWEFGGADGLTSPSFGLKTLAGGVDDYQPAPFVRSPSMTLSLVQERLAQASASEVVSHDLDPARVDEAWMLGAVNLSDRPEDSHEAFVAQILDLYLQATGQPMDPEAAEVELLISLWQQVYSVDASPTAAWTAVLTAVLRDPAILFY